jgi:hypothetical protein
VIDSILETLETLDRQIDSTSGEDLEHLEKLMEERAQACSDLRQHLRGAGENHLERISGLIASTDALKDRFTFLRVNAGEDLVLLQKQDQLLNLLAPESYDPAYMDYSA